MAKAGPRSRIAGAGAASAGTRQALVEAAVDALRSVGYVGASARAIAGRAGCNQALVFYHFGSVAGLLLAALDAVSAARLERYRDALATVRSPSELVEVAAAIFEEDLDAGYVTVLAEMIAGAASDPDLGAEVAARVATWTAFACDALRAGLGGSPLAALVPAGEAAHGIVAMYLGLEMLAHLDGRREPARALFARARQLADLLLAAGPGAALAGGRPQAPGVGGAP